MSTSGSKDLRLLVLGTEMSLNLQQDFSPSSDGKNLVGLGGALALPIADAKAFAAVGQVKIVCCVTEGSSSGSGFQVTEITELLDGLC